MFICLNTNAWFMVRDVVGTLKLFVLFLAMNVDSNARCEFKWDQ